MKKFSIIFKYCKKDFFIYFIGDILNNLAPLIIGFIFKIIIDYYNIINIPTILILLISLLFFNVFSSFISSSKPILYDNLNAKIKYKLQNNIINKLVKIDISNFDKAEFIEKMNNGIKISNGMLTQYLVSISSIISIIASSFLSFFVIFKTSWFFLLLLIINCLISYLFDYIKSNIYYKKDIQIERDNIEYTYYQSLFNNKDSIKEMNIFDIKQFFIDKVYNKAKEIQIKKNKYDRKINLLTILNYIFGFAFQLLCGMALIFQIEKGNATAGDFFYLLGLYTSLSMTLNILLNSRLESKKINKYVKHYYDLFNMDEVKNDSIDFNEPVLECKNVSFKYDNSPFMLENINLKFTGKEKVAIIGENGAGKTSLIKLLTGIYSPTSGEILLNNKSISNNSSYFENISITFQDYYKFAFDVKTNICLSDIKNIDNIAQLNETIAKTDLNNIIKNLPEGINTFLTNEYKKGIDLSEGQWQKVKIAKMIFKNSSIVFMDEPTAAIDAIQEFNLFKMISDITKDKMTFLVSHRIGFAKLADRIIVLQNGKIVEDGTHEELIRQKGIYYKMYESQASMYKEGDLNE